MYDIEMGEVSEEFANCWKAAASHLHEQGQGSLNWLRADLSPPFLEHLSFRIGNQLFFVRVEDANEEVIGPASLKGLLFVADGCNGHACLMPMMQRGEVWQCAVSGWGLIDARTQKIVNPVSFVTDEEIEMTDWELQDFAVQIVRRDLEKNGRALMSWQGNPAVDPSIWFVGDHGPEWVVVRAARWPTRDVAIPQNIDNIARGSARFSKRGNMAVVKVANANDPFDPLAEKDGNFLPLIRGQRLSVGYSGLAALPLFEAQTFEPPANLSYELIAELIGWFKKLLLSETLLPKVFMGVNSDARQFIVFVADLKLEQGEEFNFMRYVLHFEKSIAFAYKIRVMAEISQHPQILQEEHSFFSGQVGKYFAVDITSQSTDSWADGIKITRKSVTEEPEMFLQELLTQPYIPTEFDAKYAALWSRIRSKIQWRDRDFGIKKD